VSRYSNIETSLAMSTLATWVSRCPVSRCQSPQFWWSCDVRSRVFSRPGLTPTFSAQDAAADEVGLKQQ